MEKSFNKSQREAIEYGRGSLLIIAGPGSGKTTVITERVKHLLTMSSVQANEILVVTFSRAAAKEMSERFLKMNVHDGENVTFGTFHSVFNNVLNMAYGKLARNYIFDDESQDQVRFDEMLTLTHELFDARPEILEAVRKRYRWILIDEFQDIDQLQYDIIKQIAPPGKSNITIVGDDDQSIYGFRGAKAEIMLGFEKEYPGTRKVILDVNYRSHSEITNVAAKLIGNNKVRFKKEIIAARHSGGSVSVLCFRDIRQEYEYIVQEIKHSLSGGRNRNQIAILYRNNVQPWQLEVLMKQNGIDDMTYLTFHKSKGLEFEEVWIIDANACLIPNSRAKTAKQIENERRLFYVAMTRAKDELKICYSNNYKQRETRASIFIDEIK